MHQDANWLESLSPANSPVPVAMNNQQNNWLFLLIKK
jgi:hypothetical protein